MVPVKGDLDCTCEGLEFRRVLVRGSMTRIFHHFKPDVSHNLSEEEIIKSAQPAAARRRRPRSPFRARAVEFTDRTNEIHLMVER